jgi:hypothetical protein
MRYWAFSLYVCIYGCVSAYSCILHVSTCIICLMYVANYVVFYSHHLPKIPWQLPLKRVDPPAPGSTRWCVVHIHPESANTLALENGPQIGSNWIKSASSFQNDLFIATQHFQTLRLAQHRKKCELLLLISDQLVRWWILFPFHKAQKDGLRFFPLPSGWMICWAQALPSELIGPVQTKLLANLKQT